MLKMFVTVIVLVASVLPSFAVTKTFTWTWPAARVDGSTLPASAIGAITIYDTSVPAPGVPGTAITCLPVIPPTTTTGTCQASVTPGHSFVATVTDNDTPPTTSGTSNTVTVPLSAPSAITDLKVQ